MRIPIVAAILLLVFALLTNLYILKDIRQYCAERRRKLWVTVYSVFSVLSLGLIVVALSLPRKSADSSILPLIWTLYTALTIYIPQFIYCICSLIGRLVAMIFRKRGNLGTLAGISLAVLIFIVLWWGVVFTRNDIQINGVEINSAKLPESFDGMKVVQFSDAHVGTWGNDTTFMSEVVDSINALSPDLILFTGDIVNRCSSEFDPFLPVLKRLKALHGVFAVHGNHDYGGYMTWEHPGDDNRDVARLDSLMNSMGWQVLNNRTVFLNRDNDSIVLIGVENWGEPPFNQLGDLGKSYPESPDKFKGLNDNMFKILMTHNPEYWLQVVKKISNIDLSLAGHTHAMQMMLKVGKWQASPSRFRYKNWGGLYSDTASDGTPMHLYVNIGVGEVGFPARLGAAKPEITEFTLHRSQD